MRILIVGAGATGGYFGGRLLEAHQDVTFLVRPKRAAQLREQSLAIESQFGNVRLSAPTVTSNALQETFDLLLLSSKAYDLESAMESFAPAIGPKTAILPLLNGMRHLDVLKERFGAERVLGGWAMISSVVDSEGRIVHLNDLHGLSFGELNGARSPRALEILAAMSDARFEARLSESILQEMWEKWVFIAASAGITSLMRATVGDIVAAGAADLAIQLLEESAAIAQREGFPPREASMQRNRTIVTTPGSPMTASMFRDIEQGARIEADHIVGDLLQRGRDHGLQSPLLGVAYAHLKTYEARRARELHAEQTAAV
jgi:2-dehydropantoate 2-reductase